MTRFREKALASLGAVVGLAVLPVAYMLLDEYGPAGRVIFRPYLPSDVVLKLPCAAILGALLGAEAYRWLRPGGRGYSVVRVALGSLLGLGLGLAVAASVMVFTLRSGQVPDEVFAGIPVVCVLLGAWWGGITLFKPLEATPARRRFPWARLVAVALLAIWVLVPHASAFPSHGTFAERDAWARENVREYPGLARIVSEVPVVQEDVGHVVAVAPTPSDQHVFAREMNGDDMRFTLEVVGEKGRGVFFADCTIDGARMLEWRSGRWTFQGKETPVTVASAPYGR